MKFKMVFPLRGKVLLLSKKEGFLSELQIGLVTVKHRTIKALKSVNPFVLCVRFVFL
jgi:hypothetical protein